MRVAVDATPLLGARTGIGEFASKLIEGLGRFRDIDLDAFAVTSRGQAGIADLLPQNAAAVGTRRIGVPARAMQGMWRLWAFPTAELLFGPHDVVHGTNFVVPPVRSGVAVVSVHDLSPLRFPELCQPAARAYPDLVRAAVKRGAWVHTDSEFVAGEVADALGVPAERTRAVHLGVAMPAPAGGHGAAASPAGTLRDALPSWVASYVLAVGRIEPRKDLPLLVQAFSQLAPARPGLALVLCGPRGWGSSELEEAVAASPVRDRVLQLGWVDDSTRDALVSKATVFAYPSRYEGFGLPPLGAMAAGTPVVATSCGALSEVLGDAAVLVPVGDKDGLAGALARVVDDRSEQDRLSALGLERARGFSWGACVSGLVALYRDAMAATGG